ncbi:MAG: MBL fold metallo-hydrolase [Thermodesulfobacteriota bacterium]
MNIFKEKKFGPVTAWEAGFGPVGPPLMTVHVYLAGRVLIDTGQRHMRPVIVAALAGKRIETILLTHHHEDHSGNARVLAEQHGARVFGHSLAAEKLSAGYTIFPYQHLIWGKADPVTVEPLPPVIDAGGFELLPVHTPGHSRDHTVFLDRANGRLFSGDLYLGDRIKYFRADERFGDQLDSLRRVLALDFDWLLCAHRPCIGNGREHLARKLNYLEELQGEVRDLLAKGCGEREVILRMKEREVRMIKWICMGNVSFANIIRAIVREGQDIS